MNFHKIRIWGVVILLLGLFHTVRAPAQVRADHDDNPNIEDIVLTVPETYMLCPTGMDSDVVALSNVGTRWLKGYVQLDFVIPDNGGRQVVQRWDVLQGGDYRLEIVYPAWETWPEGFFEMHVDLAFEVYPTEADARAGINLLGTIGPGHPWDIFCLAERSTATPSPSPAPSPTPTLTPTPGVVPPLPPTPPLLPSPPPVATPTTMPPVAPPVPLPADPTPLPTEPLNGELLGRTGVERSPSPIPWLIGLALWIAGGIVLGRRARRRSRT